MIDQLSREEPRGRRDEIKLLPPRVSGLSAAVRHTRPLYFFFHLQLQCFLSCNKILHCHPRFGCTMFAPRIARPAVNRVAGCSASLHRSSVKGMTASPCSLQAGISNARFISAYGYTQAKVLTYSKYGEPKDVLK